ncbi:MAG: hypothetical protein F4080_14320 [Holophagales bacterium]|nr:hypothetical protein [Holophagales bacterium]
MNVGEGVGQNGLEKARSLQMHHVGAAGEYNHFAFPQVQWRRRLRATRQEQQQGRRSAARSFQEPAGAPAHPV